MNMLELESRIDGCSDLNVHLEDEKITKFNFSNLCLLLKKVKALLLTFLVHLTDTKVSLRGALTTIARSFYFSSSRAVGYPKLPLIECQSTVWPFGRLVVWPFGRLAIWPFDHLAV